MKKKGISKTRGIFLVSTFLLCTALVLWQRRQSSPDPGQLLVRDSLYQQQRLLRYNREVYLKANRTAATGDIVVRLGRDMTSEWLRRFNLADPTFSHAGIISREGDTVFVYHALGGELHPDQPLQKETLWSYGHPRGNKALGVFRIGTDSSIRAKLMQQVQASYRNRIPFDTAFDLSTYDRLYCTEFVARSFEKAFNDSAFFHRTQWQGKTYIAVDDLTAPGRAEKIAAWTY